MYKIKDYRALYLKKDGNWEFSIKKLGDRHIVYIHDFCEKNNYEFPTLDEILKNGNIVFENADNSIVVCYLPENITDEQKEQLYRFSILGLEEINYMVVCKNNNLKDRHIIGSFNDINKIKSINEDFISVIDEYYQKKDKTK